MLGVRRPPAPVSPTTTHAEQGVRRSDGLFGQGAADGLLQVRLEVGYQRVGVFGTHGRRCRVRVGAVRDARPLLVRQRFEEHKVAQPARLDLRRHGRASSTTVSTRMG